MIAAIGRDNVEHIVLLEENGHLFGPLKNLCWVGRAPRSDVAPWQTMHAVIELRLRIFGFPVRGQSRIEIFRSLAGASGSTAGAAAIVILADVGHTRVV